jgi:hypothetical protein
VNGGAGPPGTSPPGGLPPATTAPDGRVPAVTLSSSAYTVQATVWKEAGVHYMNLWGPDPGAYLTMWSWSETPGQNCLGGSGTVISGSDGQGHELHWGLVRADAAEVRVVTTGSLWTSAVIGAEVVPGLRPWIAELPPGELDRFEARDAGGNVLHTARAPVWDSGSDTC